jgi:hypothetical protein
VYEDLRFQGVDPAVAWRGRKNYWVIVTGGHETGVLSAWRRARIPLASSVRVVGGDKKGIQCLRL